MSHLSSAHPDDPHYISRSNWLRAAVLGGNDGIVSVSSLIVGIAAADAETGTVVLAGVAGLAAGAMSMAAGEYVSVSSQSDTERADIAREAIALRDMPEEELDELTEIFIDKGVSPETARQVAVEMTEYDALGAHVREELGVSDELSANPLQAALASGATFSVAAAVPVLAAWLAPDAQIIPVVLVVTIFALAALGALGARAGGSPPARAVIRTVAWGVAAMAVTAGVGWLFSVPLA